MTYTIIGIILIIILIFSIMNIKPDIIENTQPPKSLSNKLSGIKDFKVSKKVQGFKYQYIFAIDEVQEKIVFLTNRKKRIIDFSDIIGVEIIEDGQTLTKSLQLE